MSDALVLDRIEKTYNRGRENALTVLSGASLALAEGEEGLDVADDEHEVVLRQKGHRISLLSEASRS